MPKELISETASVRRYRYTDGSGKIVCISDEPIPTQREANEENIRTKAAQALAANATFLAIASPTNAQVLAQVQRLTRECNALIRLAIGALDDAADT